MDLISLLLVLTVAMPMMWGGGVITTSDQTLPELGLMQHDEIG